MALEGHRGLELVRRVVGREALEDGLVEAARRLRAVRLEAVLHADDAVRRVLAGARLRETPRVTTLDLSQNSAVLANFFTTGEPWRRS